MVQALWVMIEMIWHWVSLDLKWVRTLRDCCLSEYSTRPFGSWRAGCWGLRCPAPSNQFLAGRYVAADIYVSEGVYFNRGEFVKERMLEQFESLLQLSISCWNKSNPSRKCGRPPSITQPSSNFSHWTHSASDPGINTYTILWRADVARRKRERKQRKAAGAGV